MSRLHDTALLPEHISPDPHSLTPLQYQTLWPALLRYAKIIGSPDPHETAAEALSRGLRNLAAGHSLAGDPIPYFCRIARNVQCASWRDEKKRSPDPPAETDLSYDPDQARQDAETFALKQKTFAHQRHCLAQLPDADRSFLVAYHNPGKGANKAARKQLAESFGVTLNALRIRAARLRRKLQDCLARRAALLE